MLGRPAAGTTPSSGEARRATVVTEARSAAGHLLTEEGFELYLDELPLVEVRDLTTEEWVALDQKARKLKSLGYLGVFLLAVPLPFLIQAFWNRGGSIEMICVLLAIPCLGLASLLILAFRLRPALRLLFRFCQNRAVKDIYYLPEAKILWKTVYIGRAHDQYSYRTPMLLAPRPAEREGARLTDLENREIKRAISQETSESVTPTFFRALREADSVVYRDKDGHEYLSTGVPWWEDGKPAKWRLRGISQDTARIAHIALRESIQPGR